ncbi:MAG TPA: class I SAM-dependent methyltransferase [Candidatus Binataceae bacterium]|nr:class I SAM-dependent methyltransferase [Candidatus Binataceae bacterium]
MASAAQTTHGGPPTEAELLELLETLYNSSNPTRRWLHCTRRDWIIGQIRAHANRASGRAIEVGFGAGVYLPTLAECFSAVAATDLDQAHLDHAQPLLKRYPNLEAVADDITSSHLPAGTFDFVLCSEVIEHIPGTPRVLAGIRKLLKPGGFLLLSTPQRYSLMEFACKVAFLPGVINIVRKIYNEPVFETGHINLSTAGGLQGLLGEAGFTIRERFKSGLYIPLLAEFGGQTGLHVAQWLENRIRSGPLSFALWTQYYLAQV